MLTHSLRHRLVVRPAATTATTASRRRRSSSTRPTAWWRDRNSLPPPRPLSSFWNHFAFFLDGNIWNQKIARGFEEFVPKDGGGSTTTTAGGSTAAAPNTPTATPGANSGTKTTTNGDPSTIHAAKDSNDKSGDNKNKKKKDPKQNIPPPNDDANLPGLVALLVLILALRQYLDESETGGGLTEGGDEITFVEFRDKLLPYTEKLQVINQNLVRVVLKKNAPIIFGGTTAGGADGFLTRGGGQAGGMRHFDNEPTESIQFDTSSSSSSTISDRLVSRRSSSSSSPYPPSNFYFYIGSVDSLEEKMAAAQRDKLPPDEWTDIQYITHTNYGLELLKFVPALAFVAALYFGTKGLRMPGTGGSSSRSGGGGRGLFGIGKSNAKEIKPQDVKVKFKDVAGCDEAKREIMEFVDFLKDSSRFTKLGAKIPKGALLCGPPGTGKTLLAKATAGEAGVPFFSISGSDFIEMFVGVGPSRVRDLFKEARGKAPCIVFIDEIDAVGRQRGRGGFSGGNDERENTLNQLLVEMDGFSPTTGIVVLAGTNRVDILDEALTRPGRFDRQVQVDKPDLQGRKEIFKVHLQGIKLEGNVDDYAGRLAGLTPGFAGADIANICNEAAIVAARRKATSVNIADFEKATDRIIGGLESHKIMSPEEKAVVAYHEAGHAVAGWFLEHSDPLLKVTIIPRSSGALGFAQYLPKEVFLRSHAQIMDIVCMALAGRASEEVFFGRVTTGAADDLRRVTGLVYSTIKDFGMNDKVGQLAFPSDDGAQFGGDKPYSDSTAAAMDDEARSIVDAAYQRTLALIREHRDDTDKVAKLLLEKETITHDDIYDLVGPRPFVADKAFQEYVSSRKREEPAAATTEQPTISDDDLVNSGLTPGLA